MRLWNTKKTAQKSKQCYNKILSIRFRHNDAWNSSIASSIVNRTNERTNEKEKCIYMNHIILSLFGCIQKRKEKERMNEIYFLIENINHILTIP